MLDWLLLSHKPLTLWWLFSNISLFTAVLVTSIDLPSSSKLLFLYSPNSSSAPSNANLFFVCFCLFTAAPAAYRSSQVRGRITAVAAGLWHSNHNTRSNQCLWPTPQQCWIPNPLSKAKDQTHILTDTSQVHYFGATMGTPMHARYQMLSYYRICISF